MATPPPSEQPRQVPPEQAQPEPQVGAAQAIGAGAAATALAAPVGTAAGMAAVAPAVPLLWAQLKGIEAILKALRAFFALFRARQARWWADQRARPSAGRIANQDWLDLVAEENARQAEFERRVEERVRRDVGLAEKLPVKPPAPGDPDPLTGTPKGPTGKIPWAKNAKTRQEAIDAIARREQVWARQRAEALAIRALSALDRSILRQESPLGAFWRRNTAVIQPFPDSLVMDGHFVPWAVLDGFHPPTHPLDHCTLHSRAEAIARGWLTPQNDLSVAQATNLVTKAKAANAAIGWLG